MTEVSTRAVSRIATNIKKYGTTRPAPTGFKIGRPTSMSKDMAQALVQWVDDNNCQFQIKDAVAFLKEQLDYKGCEVSVGRVLARAGYQRKESGRGKRNDVAEWSRPENVDWDEVLASLNANEERRYVSKKKRKHDETADGETPGPSADGTSNDAPPAKAPRVRKEPAPKEYKRGPYKTDPNKVERRGRPRFVPQADMIINGHEAPGMPSTLDPRLAGSIAPTAPMRKPLYVNSNNIPPSLRDRLETPNQEVPTTTNNDEAESTHQTEVSPATTAPMSPSASLQASLARLQSLGDADALTQEQVIAAVVPNIDVEALQSQVASQQQLIAQLQKQLAKQGRQSGEILKDETFEV